MVLNNVILSNPIVCIVLVIININSNKIATASIGGTKIEGRPRKRWRYEAEEDLYKKEEEKNVRHWSETSGMGEIALEDNHNGP